MAQIIDIKTGAIHDFEREKRVREILDNTQKRSALQQIIEHHFSEAHILEEEVVTSLGENVVLFSVSGRDDLEGVMVSKKDLVSGVIKRNDIYLALAERLSEG